MWGRYERLKRSHKEYYPLAPDKVQSEAVGRTKPMASMLAPVKDGALGWRLPAIQEPQPDSLEALETMCYIIKNLMFLVGWVKSVASLETFHNRFWSRVRANKRAKPGYRALNVQEYVDAYMKFQGRWKKASQNAVHLDDALLASLPAENDELDGRLGLAPRLAVQPLPGTDNRGNKRPLALEDDNKGSRAPGDAAAPPAPKARKTTRNDRQKRKVANLENALALANAKATQNGGGPKTAPRTSGKGAGKGAGKGKRGVASQWCKHMAETGACPFGDRCWFRHT